MKRGLLAVAILGLLLQGCFYGHRESRTQQADESYLMFVGNLADVVVTVDGNDFVPDPGKQDDPRAAQHKYRLKPGNHLILVKRHGKLLIERKVYIGPGETKEIRIP